MTTDHIESTEQDAKDAGPSVVRRRLLLARAVKGAVVLGATVPIQTLASQSLLTFDGKFQCSVSGLQSGVHSATPTDTPRCGGYNIAYWAQASAGAPTVPNPPWPPLPNGWTYATPCQTVFLQSNLAGNPSLFQVMSSGSYTSSDEIHWICAWLNALKHAFNFPYTDLNVLAFYNQGVASTAYQDALYFFRNYMETHTA